MRRKSSPGKRIVAAMSGGVDSAVAAALLKREGYDVIGATFRMWPKEECGSCFGRACRSLEAIARARAVAERLDIPYYVFDLSDDFKREVIDYFCDEYLKGRTPNPCVVCNEKIKFGLFVSKARSLGAELVATGHYALVERRGKRYLLREGRDRAKDQAYFLFSLSQEQLKSAVFPLGRYTKDRTRKAAKRFELTAFDAASSQDVCFIQDLEYAEYIRKKTGMEIKKGDIVDGSGKILGSHKGTPFYTIGQRRGLGIAYKEPLYVTAIDIAHNRVIVGIKSEVLKKTLIAHRLNWIATEGIDKPLRAKAKIRYNHKKDDATVTRIGPDSVRVDFDRLQEAPTPGQAVVFYDKDVVLGGGWIKEAS
ncbi:MAG: tRNA 2-thiouridine(34) synthase MnmA [Candidatus Omnitrophica bacterium]|nr:tRNA 2-thiouridine(34) synthase MnmA [Candidatus Omnitrophota bacterium]